MIIPSSSWRHIWRSARNIGLAVLLLFAAAPILGAHAASDLPRDIAQLYRSVSISPPTAKAMTVCYGFVCRRRETLDFSAADRAALSRLLAAGRPSPEAERAAISRAVIWFDRKMGPHIGTSKRVARADFRSGSDHTNYDCWDTTRNVTSLLLVLQSWNMLHHHSAGNPHYRGNVLQLQTPHNTAVVVEKASRREWAVDMWTRGYGEAPEIMPVSAWAKEK